MYNKVSTVINLNLTHEVICFDHVSCLNKLGCLGCTLYILIVCHYYHWEYARFLSTTAAIVFYYLKIQSLLNTMSAYLAIVCMFLMFLATGCIISILYSLFTDTKSRNKELDIKKSFLREEQLRKVRGVVKFIFCFL